MARPKGKGHRVALTLDKQTNELFDRFSELSGVPKATLLRDYIEQIVPFVQETVTALEKLKSGAMTMSDAQHLFLNAVADVNEETAKAIREISKPLENKDVTNDGSSD